MKRRRDMKRLIHLMVQSLVDEPGEVVVEEVNGGRTTVFEVRVAKGDLGKVIGKKGRNADAIRTIVNAVSSKQRKRVIVEIIDDNAVKEAYCVNRDARKNRVSKVFAVNR
jgi:predicted RNA-binding protein YlqC (UPF0109 family)